MCSSKLELLCLQSAVLLDIFGQEVLEDDRSQGKSLSSSLNK